MSVEDPEKDSPSFSEKITDYVLLLQQDDEEQLGLWSSWKQIYILVLVYGSLQILILYFFTRIFNHP
ncbi:MAG: hypothetical protein AB1757_28335 [Acidobacteriota bacterium]